MSIFDCEFSIVMNALKVVNTFCVSVLLSGLV